MVKHTQTIRRQQPMNCLSVFDHFMGLALKGLTVLGGLAMKQLISNASTCKYLLKVYNKNTRATFMDVALLTFNRFLPEEVFCEKVVLQNFAKFTETPGPECLF